MPIYYYDFNEETRKVDIDIKQDKTEYKPGDEVNLTIKTTNNNKPIKTFVNISVVNEAVFAVQEDSTEIVSTIYQDPEYPIYTYSSYFDFISKEQMDLEVVVEIQEEISETQHILIQYIQIQMELRM